MNRIKLEFKLLKDGLFEFGSALPKLNLSKGMAINELDGQYSRAILGKSWIGVTFLLFISIKIVIFGSLNGVPLTEFAPYLALGFMCFRFISTSVVGGSRVFVSAQNWIKTESLSLTVYLQTFLIKNLIMLGYMMVPALLVCFITGAYSWVGLLSFPFFLLVFAFNNLWVSTLLSFFSTRYRDIIHFLTTIMQLLYFATPILWVPTEEGMRSWIALLNPLTHYIAIIRDPFMYGTIPWMSWWIVLSITAVFSFIALRVFSTNRTQLVYWI